MYSWNMQSVIIIRYLFFLLLIINFDCYNKLNWKIKLILIVFMKQQKNNY
jgi:hypothetical protein